MDIVTVHARGGNGGNGCVSFRREKFVPRGGPDGGDGGCGGCVFLQGDKDENSLIRLFYTPHQNAKNGGHGKGKNLHGHNGEDLVIKIPCGTEAWDSETGRMLGAIVAYGEKLLVARGGQGGLGNCHWRTASHRALTRHTDGEQGEQATLRLELKLIADMGLVGFPNAGKSSLLAHVSDAHPKIASYPFTTLNPIIGTMIFENYTRLTIADIPGLIKGAHEGIGLGHAFLRHIERSSSLIYVIDMAGVDARHPHEDYFSLREELELHKHELISRPSVIVANKMDLPQAAGNLEKFKDATRLQPIPVSAVTGQGLDDLKGSLYRLWDRSRR